MKLGAKVFCIFLLGDLFCLRIGVYFCISLVVHDLAQLIKHAQNTLSEGSWSTRVKKLL